MSKYKLITFLIFIFICFSFNITKAACPLNLNNLSIDNQTNKDISDIIRLQSIMYINNLYDGPITGYYGTKTENAINWFKQSYGLNPNGIVDQDTIDLLCSNYTLCPFQTNLEKNDETPVREIKALQSFLKLLPNIYPEKLVTGFYGTKTEKAVKRLQKQLNISQTGKIDNTTKQEFCNFFKAFDSNDTTDKNNQDTTTKISQIVCTPSVKQAKINETVTFISQIIGNQNSTFKYIWNNKINNNQKTFKTSFSTSGNKTINLKVIDSQGNILSTTCKIKITDTEDTNNINNSFNFNIDIMNQESSRSDDGNINIDLNNFTSTPAPNKIINWLKSNWNAWCNKSVNSYTPTWNGNAYTCNYGNGLYSYEECQQITNNLYKTNLFSLKGNQPNIPMFTSLYCNTFTHQCVDSNYILKDSNNQPCNYYNGPYKYYTTSTGSIDNDCQKNCYDLSIATNYSETDQYGNVSPITPEEKNYINYEPNSEDFQKCFPIAYNFGKNYGSMSITSDGKCGNLRLIDGILQKIQFSNIQNNNYSSSSTSSNNNTSSNNTISEQIDPPSAKTTYPKRYKCSGGVGCIACEKNESCPYESYYQCLDYCWWEAGKPEIQRKTEQSDVPQDSGAIGAEEEDPNSQLGAEKYDGNKLSGKYKCAWSSQCIPCTNDQVKTTPSCWFNSADECKEQCHDYSN